MALGRDINFHAAQPFARTPPASLTDRVFQPADQPIRYPNGLAMYKPQFLSSVDFPIHIALAPLRLLLIGHLACRCRAAATSPSARVLAWQSRVERFW